MAFAKPAERRQRRNKRSVVIARIVPKRAIPAAPAAFLAQSKTDWRLWWRSKMGRFADAEIDLPTVRRLFGLRDERDRVSAQLAKQAAVVRGSERQPVLSPLVRRQAMLDTEIRLLETALERRLLERSQFGPPDELPEQTLEDLNRGWDDDDDDSD